MIASNGTNRLMCGGPESAEPGCLTDIGTVELDTSLPREERLEALLGRLQNPYHFRCGALEIRLTFDEAAPPLQAVLADLLIRQRSGL